MNRLEKLILEIKKQLFPYHHEHDVERGCERWGVRGWRLPDFMGRRTARYVPAEEQMREERIVRLSTATAISRRRTSRSARR